MTDDLDDDPTLIEFRRELEALPEFHQAPPSRHRVRASARAVGYALGGVLRVAAGALGLAGRGTWTLAGELWSWTRGHDFRRPYTAASERGRGRDMELIAEAYRDAVAWRRGRALAWLAALALAALIAWHRAPGVVVLAGVLAVVALAVVGARARADEPDLLDDEPLLYDEDDDEVLDAEIVDTAALTVLPGPWPLRHGGIVDTSRGVPVGTDDHGAVVTVPLDRHCLTAGCTGSGKSMMLRSIALGALADPAAEVHVWSAKGDRDFRDLAPACASSGGGPSSMAALAAVLARIVAELPAREDAGAPPCVVVLDELHHALSHGEHGSRITAAVVALAELGRSAGMVLIAGVQRPTRVSIPPRVAEQLEIRIGMRVRTPAESRVLFGEGAIADGLEPHRFPADRPGLAWIDGAGPAPVRVRGWLISEADAAAVVRRATDRRGPLGGRTEPAGPFLAIEAAPTDDVDTTGCLVCSGPVRPGATYCSPKCRTAAYRRRRGR